MVLLQQEMTTRERQRASVRVRISVVDGDDQYPHFLPCQLMSHDVLSVCVSPMYTANITEREELTGPITFSPGPIFAEDGDRGIMAPISYSLLSGPDSDIFQIDNITGSVSLLHPVENKPGSSILNLKVMASQVGDPRKYSITEVQVRILSANQHAPQFASTQYQAFVHEDPSPAALVSTYNSRVLSLTPLDEDFPNASNPQIRLSLNSLSNHSQLFQITPSGLLIAKTNQLQAPEHYYLQVIARDEESGETANCSVTVKVLAHGQAAPRDPSESQPIFTLPDLPILAGGLGVLIFLFAAMLCLLIRIVKGHRQQQQQMSRTSLVTEKHPSVMNPGKSSPPTEEQCYQNAAYSETPGEESAGQERRNIPSVSGQNRTKEPGKIDGNQGKQQRKTPAVAIISPGNQCMGRSPCINSRQEAAKPIKTTMDTSTIEKNKVETAQVLVITEGTDSPPLMVPPVGSCSPQTSSDQLVPTDPGQDEPDRQDGPVMWPDPPLLSRLPIVVEVNEELVEPEAERNESAPLMGSEVITPGSLMQLMEDSIEC
ncbi:cadherin-related family member 5-like [Bombina bombina]|uniref:cadherin-related family member 5-like n=1 Tax=Bombina bombina TaxID=8345 RepID=UPI00235AB28D|nr:cadherin-related family member 5-like [Bombina bombina]